MVQGKPQGSVLPEEERECCKLQVWACFGYGTTYLQLAWPLALSLRRISTSSSRSSSTENRMPMETTFDRNLLQQNSAQCTACAQSTVRQCNGARTWMQARRTRGRAGRSGGSEHAARQEERTRAQSRRAESTSQEAPRVKVKIWYQLLTGNNGWMDGSDRGPTPGFRQRAGPAPRRSPYTAQMSVKPAATGVT